MGRAEKRSRQVDDSFWEDYHTYDELKEFALQVAADNEGVSTEVIGQSYEGRDMTVLKIERAGLGAKNVWVESGE